MSDEKNKPQEVAYALFGASRLKPNREPATRGLQGAKTFKPEKQEPADSGNSGGSANTGRKKDGD